MDCYQAIHWINEDFRSPNHILSKPQIGWSFREIHSTGHKNVFAMEFPKSCSPSGLWTSSFPILWPFTFCCHKLWRARVGKRINIVVVANKRRISSHKEQMCVYVNLSAPTINKPLYTEEFERDKSLSQEPGLNPGKWLFPVHWQR